MPMFNVPVFYQQLAEFVMEQELLFDNDYVDVQVYLYL